jgi:hypothetical protein
MLKRCSEKKDIAEWNAWRTANEDEEVWLCGARLSGRHLSKVYFGFAHLEGAALDKARLIDANFKEAHLSGACFNKAPMKKAYLNRADAREARFLRTGLEAAELYKASLQGADFEQADLINVNMGRASLQSANFRLARTDGETKVWAPKVDRATNFDGVGLDNIRTDPRTKQSLKDNIREHWWRDWCMEGKWWRRSMTQWITRAFWWMSDYGRSTRRILACFFALALVFGLLYCLAPDMLKVDGEVGNVQSLWHALYFSVVTMTTLGFGDVHARPDCWWGVLGQGILMLQVILGYVLLGALVTRFAILFSGEGPAQSPSPPKEPENKSDD